MKYLPRKYELLNSDEDEITLSDQIPLLKLKHRNLTETYELKM